MFRSGCFAFQCPTKWSLQVSGHKRRASVHEPIIELAAADARLGLSSENLVYAVFRLQQRDLELASAQVDDEDLANVVHRMQSMG